MEYIKGDIVKIVATNQIGVVQDSWYHPKNLNAIYVITEVDSNGMDEKVVKCEHKDLELVCVSTHVDFYKYCKKMFFFMEEDK